MVETENANGKVSVALYAVDPTVGLYHRDVRWVTPGSVFDMKRKWHLLYHFDSMEEARDAAQRMYNEMMRAKNAYRIVRTKEEFIS